jgi:hypothetical protein
MRSTVARPTTRSTVRRPSRVVKRAPRTAVANAVATDSPRRINPRTIVTAAVAFALVWGIGGLPASTASSSFECEPSATLATGRPDKNLISHEASKGVRAFWCERYGANGTAIRTGPYWETYANGRTRTVAHYVDSRLTGPVSIHNEDGSLFLRGFLDSGEWSGALEMFHQNGAIWLDAHFAAGSLEGDVRTRFPDGALESETRFQAGREDGLARSFYPTTAGGRLKSEAQVEADQLVGSHRVLDRKGKLVLRIDWDSGPLTWRNITAQPAAPDFGPREPSDATRERDLRD